MMMMIIDEAIKNKYVSGMHVTFEFFSASVIEDSIPVGFYGK
jgi:hypothetical protein